MTAAAIEITDCRTAVIGHAREVLERACDEARSNPAATGNLSIVIAIARLQRVLVGWTSDPSEEAKDDAIRACVLRTMQLVAVIEDELDWAAAEYVSSGDGSDEEGETAA